MKRLALAVMVTALALTGCARGLSDMAVARDECHEYGGVFESWKNEFGYHWECDLSDPSSDISSTGGGS